MGIQILLIDDEEEFVETLRTRLSLRGFETRTALNGTDALEKLKTIRVDIVILDVCMPGRDGMDVLREIKRIDPSLPVIMLTGHAELDTSMTGLTLGADDYLIKPVQIEGLIEKIKMAVEHRQLLIEKEKNNQQP